MLVYRKYARSLTREEQERLWQDYRVVGRLFGLGPRRDAGRHRRLRALHGRHVPRARPARWSPQARELAIDVVLRPPVPLHFRPLVELANQITVGLLPSQVRREFGFRWDPLRSVALHGGAEYVKRVLVPLIPERARTIPVARAA